MKFEKQNKKIAITKAYDLLELKANGRIDDDGDYLDDDGNKLTKTIIIKEPHGNKHHWESHVKVVETLENKQNKIHEDGFICIGVAGEKWCVRRDIFLSTYEETSNV